MKSSRIATVLLCSVNAALILGALHWMGCATPTQQQSQQPKDPGLYSVVGWYNSGVYWPTGGAGTASAVDIDGTVGHPLTIWGPRGTTVPSTANFTYSYRITSGELPPGMSFDSQNYGAISGIPTQRGHWILTLEVYSLQLNSPYISYAGFTQQLRIHVTGSGEVNE